MSKYTGLKLRNVPDKRRCIRRIRPGNRIYMSEILGKTVESSRPGQHRQSVVSRKISDSRVQLFEKQKLQFNYGLNEKQLSRLVKEARKSKIAAGEKLAELIERRLDNVVFRSGFAHSIPAARQLVNHGHIQVNERRVDIASHRVSVGDVIGPKLKSQNLPVIKEAVISLRLARPDWLECNYMESRATMIGNPGLESLSVKVEIARVIEYYAKRG